MTQHFQPLKRKDFKPCLLCGKGVMHTGLPMFWRVHVERLGVDMRAVQRQHGMEQFFGGSSPGAVALADIFSDGAPIATPMDVPKVHLICESCAIGIAVLGS